MWKNTPPIMAPGKREHSSVKQRENILEKVFQQRVWHSYCNIQTALLLEWNQMALGNDHIVLGQQHIQGPEALVRRMRCLNTQETFPGGELLLWYLTRWQSVSFNPLSFEQWFIVMNRSPPFVCLFFPMEWQFCHSKAKTTDSEISLLMELLCIA